MKEKLERAMRALELSSTLASACIEMLSDIVVNSDSISDLDHTIERTAEEVRSTKCYLEDDTARIRRIVEDLTP